jgi:hypothetical protein
MCDRRVNVQIGGLPGWHDLEAIAKSDAHGSVDGIRYNFPLLIGKLDLRRGT